MGRSANSVHFTQRKLGRSRQRPLLELLELPRLERRLLTHILRQGPITLETLIEQSSHTPEAIAIAIEHLIQQGWIVKDPTTCKVRYRTENPTNPEV